MVDIVSVLSLQGRARRNAKKSLWMIQRQRAERAEAAHFVREARARAGTSAAAAAQARRT